MTGKKTPTARDIAIAALNQFDPKRNYASTILNKLLPKTDEKQRATDLVFGSIRNRSALDLVITRFADCPAERIPHKLLNIIRIGTYELCYGPLTADYSIVNEAVESAKAVAGGKQPGFVNAVLRQITKHIQNRQISLPEADPKRTLPQTSLTGCEFDSSLLPDPQQSQADYLSAAFSLPKWLITDWLSEFGPEKTRKICLASNRRPSIYLRPNTLKTSIQHLAEKLHQADIEAEIVAGESMLKIKSPRLVTDLPGFAQGLFSVQDITASQPLRLLNPQPNQTILDLCAAPGTKAAQLAELTADKTKIIATDIDNQRLEKLKENITRLGLRSISIVSYENLQTKSSEIGFFDAVLLDVPCSNTGVLAKRIEARYRIKPITIKQLTKTQGDLLQTAAKMLKTHGRICYSTCSLQSPENSSLVKQFLKKNHNFELESELLTLPSAEKFDRDGGYVAVISHKPY